jgi:cardiolipin synthase
VIDDIDRAKQLDMMVAYFSPRRGLVKKIGEVARRGARNGGGARLLLAAKSDNAATIGAARANYGRLLKRGVEIHEFKPCKLHAKLIVVDDNVYIGSANFDMRSLYLNLEVMLRIEDAALASRMREFIEGHLPYSTEVTRRLHRRRSTWWNRVRWTIGWYLVTVVDYSVTRRLNLGL